MNSFKCQICGENHKISKGIEVTQPESILNIPKTEIAKRVKEIQGSYILDDKIFILNGDIFICKKEETIPFFNWSVWVSLSLSDFQAQSEKLSKRENVEFSGQLETNLPFYEKTKGLKVKIFINLDYDYAVVKINEESQIKKDQIEKISTERVIELMQKIHHPEN